MTTDPDSPRKLTTEEIYQDLYREFRKAMIKIGHLNSEIQELVFLKEKLEKKLSELEKPVKGEIRAIKKESEYVKDLLIKIKRLEDQNVRLRQGNGELISKLLKYEKQGI